MIGDRLSDDFRFRLILWRIFDVIFGFVMASKNYNSNNKRAHNRPTTALAQHVVAPETLGNILKKGNTAQCSTAIDFKYCTIHTRLHNPFETANLANNYNYNCNYNHTIWGIFNRHFKLPQLLITQLDRLFYSIRDVLLHNINPT